MESPERLQQRIKSIGDLDDIVGTMKALSAASIHQYEKAVSSLADYWHTVERGLYIVMRDSEKQAVQPHPHNGRLAVVVYGSDHGLCGRFNEEIAEYTLEHIKTLPTDFKPKILCVGMRAADKLEMSGQPVDKVLNLPGAANQIGATIQDILLHIDRWREEDGLEHLYLFHNRPSSRATYRPTRFHLLPLNLSHFQHLEEEAWSGSSLPTYTMDRDTLLSSLLHQYFFISLFRACAESQSAEHGSRLAAMQAAEKNLDENKEELIGEYRRVRQAMITTELLDVVAGFEAVSND